MSVAYPDAQVALLTPNKEMEGLKGYQLGFKSIKDVDKEIGDLHSTVLDSVMPQKIVIDMGLYKNFANLVGEEELDGLLNMSVLDLKCYSDKFSSRMADLTTKIENLKRTKQYLDSKWANSDQYLSYVKAMKDCYGTRGLCLSC